VTLIDTHAHLADAAFDADRDDVLRRARAAGVGVVVEIGEEEARWPKARALADRFPGVVYWCAGFHPYYAGQADEGLGARLRAALSHPACVGVGEIGLDYHRPDPAPEVQRRVFAALARAALEAGKPLVLHCRDAAGEERAQRDMLDVLDAVGASPGPAPVGVAHCFQGTIDNARRFVERGFLIGVDAPITYPKAAALRAMIATVPLTALVLETDCPYLPPQSHRGKRNEPAHVPAVAAALAALLGAPPADVAAATTRNARRLYRLPEGATAH
jgi:TatD DNase family protein